MKKITLLAAMLLTTATTLHAQCNDDVPLPYLENFDTAILPDLPDCTFSYKLTFVGSDWTAAAAPNSSFTGNVAQYNTETEEGWSMMCSYIMRPVQLTAGMGYKVSYKYAHNDNETTINELRASLSSNNPQPEIALGIHESITGSDVVNHSTTVFTVPTTGSYYLRFDISSEGNQGILYLDDIKIEDMGVMGTHDMANNQLAYYPNPVKDILTITNNTPLQQLELFNTAGQVLLTQSSSEEIVSLNIENFAAGIYFLKVKSGPSSQTVRLVKQ